MAMGKASTRSSNTRLCASDNAAVVVWLGVSEGLRACAAQQILSLAEVCQRTRPAKEVRGRLQLFDRLCFSTRERKLFAGPQPGVRLIGT